MPQLTEELILQALSQIIDPDLHKDIVTLGFIKDLKISGGDVSFRIVLTTPACPVKEEMEGAARELVRAIPGVQTVSVKMDAEVPKEEVSREGYRSRSPQYYCGVIGQRRRWQIYSCSQCRCVAGAQWRAGWFNGCGCLRSKRSHHAWRQRGAARS